MTPTQTLPAALVRELRSLAPLPATAHRLMAIAATGADVSGAELADLVEHDAALTAVLLRHVSTAAHAAATPIALREVVLRLGVVAVLDLAMDGYLARLRQAAPLYDLSEHDLWAHGAAARLAAAAIRQVSGVPPLAETAALVHDIGKLVIARHLGHDVHELVAYARLRRTTFVAAERAVLGTDHAEVGAAMAEHWKFPAAITQAIARHHDGPDAPADPVLDTVMVANVVAKTVEAGLGAEGLNFAVDRAAYRRLGLDFAAFGRICLATEAGLRQLEGAGPAPR